VTTFIAIACLFAGVFLTLGALYMVVRRALRQLAVANTYREVAQELGLQVDTRGASVRGHLGDRRIWIGEVLEAHGLERRIEVRGLIGFERPLALGLHVQRRGRASRLLRQKQLMEVAIGEPDLDRAVVVQGDEAERTRAVFTPEVRAAIRVLLSKCREIAIHDEEVQVWLSAPEESRAALHDLVNAMLRLSEAIEAARRGIPAPASLDGSAPMWAELASSLGLELEGWLPGISGMLDGHRVLLATHRENDGYAAALRLWFNPHPDLGLLLRPQVEPDGYWSVGQDIQVGDRPFDEAFVIKGYDPHAVVARLNADVRKGLLGLRARGRVVVDDRGLVLTGLGLDAPAGLADALKAAAAVANAIGW
jgi:hypothetical protein